MLIYVPDDAWETLWQTLMLDSESSAVDPGLREDIKQALRQMVMMKDHEISVCACGNFSEGFSIRGPYPSYDDASEWNQGPDTWITGVALDEKALQEIADLTCDRP